MNKRIIAVFLLTSLFLQPSLAVQVGNDVEYFPEPINVGIGKIDPQARLDVNGQVLIRGGTPQANAVLTSDATGLATWQDLSALITNITSATSINAATFTGGTFTGDGSGLTGIVATSFANGVTATTVFGTDNRLLRSDGVSRGSQASGITIDDSNNISGAGTIGSGAITSTGAISGTSFSTTGVISSTAAAGNTVVVDGNTFVVDATNNRVGIGTTTPTTALQVAGTVTATNFSGSGAGLSNLQAGSIVGSLSGIDILGGTINGASLSNVDLSDTIISSLSAPDGSPNPALSIDNNGRALFAAGFDAKGTTFNLGDTGTTASIALATGGTSLNIRNINAGGATQIDYPAVSGVFKIRTNDGATTTDRFCINSTGNVGVGNSSPTAKFDVTGTVKATSFVGDGSGLTGIPSFANGVTATTVFGTDNRLLRSDGASRGAQASGITIDDSNNISGAGTIGSGAITSTGAISGTSFSTTGVISSTAAAGNTVVVDGNTFVVDATNNRVGIGTTTPTTALQVAGTVTATNFSGSGAGLSNLQAGSIVGSLSGIDILGGTINGASLSNVDLSDTIISSLSAPDGSPNPALSIDNNGRALFAAGFDAKGTTFNFGDTGTTASIALATGGTSLNIRNINAGGATQIDYPATSGVFKIRTNDGATTTDRFCINPTGNVGIGNSAPTVKLDVTGTVKATSFVGDGSGLTGIPSFANGVTATTVFGTDNRLLRSDGVSRGSQASGITIDDSNNISGAGTIGSGAITSTGAISGTSFSTTGVISSTAVAGNTVVVDGNTFVVDATNNRVGIGTTTPTTALQVAGTVTATNFSGSGAGLSNLQAGSIVGSLSGIDILGGTINGASLSNVDLSDTIISSLSAPDGSPNPALSVDNNGKIGIGTTTPDAKLAILDGSIMTSKTGAVLNTYTNVASFSLSTVSITGVLKITLPKTWSNTMLQIKINGYNYNSTSGAWELLVGGYNYSPSTRWVNTSATLTGKAPFTKVRLAHDGVNNIILLGDVDTVWSYPKAQVTEVVAGHLNITGWGEGWTLAIEPGDADYLAINEPSLHIYTAASGNVGIGTTAPTQKLEVAGTVKATSFVGDGSLLTGIPSSANSVTATTVFGTDNRLLRSDGVSRGSQASGITIDDSNNISGAGTIGSGAITSTGAISGTSFSTTGVISSTAAAGNTVIVDGNTFVVDATNNRVGIGTTTPTTALQVAGTVTATNFSGSGAGLSNLQAGSIVGSLSGIDILGGTINGASLSNVDLSDTIISSLSAPDGSPNPALTVDNIGNIGIGDVTPDALLEVAGGDFMVGESTATVADFYVKNSVNAVGFGIRDPLERAHFHQNGGGPTFVAFTNTDTSATNLDGISNGSKLGLSSTEDFEIYNYQSGKDIDFYTTTGTSNGLRMTIDAAGNVGIGTAINVTPTEKLEVIGNVKATNFIGNGAGLTGIVASSFTGVLPASQIDPNFRPSALQASDGSPSPALSVDNTGNVGIGTTTPIAELDVKATSNSGYVTIRANDGAIELGSGNDGLSYIDFKGSTNLAADLRGRILYNDASGFSIFTGANSTTPKVSITEPGSVGIGDTTPDANLDVNGSLLSNTFYLASQVTVAGASPTTTINWNTANRYILTLGTSVNLVDFTDPPATSVGSLVLEIKQDATGGRVVTLFDSKTRWPGGYCPPLSTTPNAVDVISCIWDGSLYMCQLSKDFKPQGTP